MINPKLEGAMEDRKYADLTDRIICAFYNVYNSIGYGFLEKVYENALLIELEQMSIQVDAQVPITVSYKDHIVGDYFCDLMIEEKIIIEIKAAKSLLPEHEAQLLNYLKATELEVGLLFNFGLNPIVKRKVFSNSRK
jgi:GxxExxY protein